MAVRDVRANIRKEYDVSSADKLINVLDIGAGKGVNFIKLKILI